MSPLHHIRILSDGKRGHENQSLGLAEALRLRTQAEIETITFGAKDGLLSRLCQATAAGPIPQLIVAAGHSTHLPLLWAAKRFNIPSILLMKPTLPIALFDLCIIPRHDLRGHAAPSNVIPTLGMLNRLPPELPTKEDSGLILLGGPSKHHGWEPDPLLKDISNICNTDTTLTWTLTDSRRTPEGFLQTLRERDLSLNILSHHDTPADWLPAQLAKAKTVWVTEDSASMVSEALTAGANVGILPAPIINPHSRIVQGLDSLLKEGWAQTYQQWQKNPEPLNPPSRLHEASRCADLILDSGIISH